MNNKIDKTCLRPFQLWVLNNFPFTIDDWDSITQYQMLCKIMGALKEQLDVNSDLYKKITDLENYLTNLDLQEYVDNKIDELLENGTLQEIITSYLQINGILSFDTVSDMVASTNVINGSSCKTLGLNTYNDGKGQFYKIREITNEDVVDGVNIIALTNSNTLIAELLPNYYIENLTSQVNTLNSNVSVLQNKKYILIGDSYGVTTTQRTQCWTDYIISYLNLTLNTDVFVSCASSRGFLGDPGQSGDMTFLTLLQNLSSSITNKNEITDIIVCGGTNDKTYSYENISTAMASFYAYCEANYPNAKVSVGFISWAKNPVYLAQHKTAIYNYKMASVRNRMAYINGSENCWHYSGWLLDDVHPNNDGSRHIACGIINYLLTGVANLNIMSRTTGTLTLNSTLFDNSYTNTFISSQSNDNLDIYLNLTAVSTDGFNYTCNGNYIEIGDLSNSQICGGTDFAITPCQFMIYDGTNCYDLVGNIKIQGLKVYISINQKSNNTTTDLTVNIKQLQINNRNFRFTSIGN